MARSKLRKPQTLRIEVMKMPLGLFSFALRSLLRLDHPNVVTLFEIFEDADTLSLVS